MENGVNSAELQALLDYYEKEKGISREALNEAIKDALELVTWASSQDSNSEEDGWNAPVVLFPQGAAALSPAADGITFMMLMNSTSPRFLIEEQVAGAPYIREAGIIPLPMGYVICAPGGRAMTPAGACWRRSWCMMTMIGDIIVRLFVRCFFFFLHEGILSKFQKYMYS